MSSFSTFEMRQSRQVRSGDPYMGSKCSLEVSMLGLDMVSPCKWPRLLGIEAVGRGHDHPRVDAGKHPGKLLYLTPRRLYPHPVAVFDAVLRRRLRVDLGRRVDHETPQPGDIAVLARGNRKAGGSRWSARTDNLWPIPAWRPGSRRARRTGAGGRSPCP